VLPSSLQSSGPAAAPADVPQSQPGSLAPSPRPASLHPPCPPRSAGPSPGRPQAGFDFKNCVALPTEGILYALLTGLAADEVFAYLGVRASLVGALRSRRQALPDSAAVQRRTRSPAPCLAAEKEHIFTATRHITGKVRHHKYLLGQMVPAMRMVADSRFRYSAPLVPWTDAELDRLHRVWLQVQRAAWWLPPGYPSAPLSFPSARGGCPEAHPVVPMVQALAKHIEQHVALPDEIRETTIRKYKKLCDSCG
jgi:hypothetical protein